MNVVTSNGCAQIGGKTGADSPVMLEDVEDLDTTAGGVLRAWVSDHVQGESQPLGAVVATTGGLTLAPGQSPAGALRFRMQSRFDYVSYGFGVPTPAVAGESTLSFPGDTTSFTHLTFLVCASINLTNQKKEVILTTYPGQNFPTLHWKYSVSAGTTYQRVSIDLHAPDYITNAGSFTVAQLLAQTRFLYFYFYGGPEATPKTLTVYLDDIQLLRNEASIADWAVY